MRELRGELSGGGESFEFGESPRRAVEFEVRVFELYVALGQLRCGFADALFEQLVLRLALGGHLAQSREHSVELARERADLVARSFGGLRREVAAAHAPHRAEQTLDGPVDEVSEEKKDAERDE